MEDPMFVRNPLPIRRPALIALAAALILTIAGATRLAAPARAEPLPLADLAEQPVQLCGPSATFSGTIVHAESLPALGDAQPKGVWVVVVVDVVNDGPDRSWLFESAMLMDEAGTAVRNDTISSVPAAAAAARFRVKSQETHISPGDAARVALVFDVSTTATAFELLPILDYCP
jgi:hypothetical protein